MTTKAQAQVVQAKLEQQFAGCSFGLGKDGDNWTVEVRDSGGQTLKLPASMDGVTVRFRATGPIQAL